MEKKKKRQILYIVLSIMIIVMFIGLYAGIVYFASKGLALTVVVLGILPITFIIIAGVQRYKEIKGGEEDDSSKY